MKKASYRIPDKIGPVIIGNACSPDCLYTGTASAAIYVREDVVPIQKAEIKELDDLGYLPIIFGSNEHEWPTIIEKHLFVFKNVNER